MNNLKILAAATALILSSCAKDRPIEKQPDPENSRWSKSLFLHDKTGEGQSIQVQSGEDKSQSNVARKVFLSKVTVVKTSSNGGFTFVGFQSDLKAGYFDFTEKQLRYLSAVSPYGTSAKSEPELVNSWNISHTETRLAELDGKVTNREEENAYLPWYEKDKFTVDWTAANMSEAATFPYTIDIATMAQCWSKKASHIVEGSEDLTDDYISFVIAADYQVNSLCPEDIRRHIRGDFTYTVHYKYSFAKMKKSTYQPFVYKGESDPLMAKYGYFQTIKETLGADGRYKNTILMNRWNPEKVHTYYFSEDFPQQYKWIFSHPQHGIMAKTNKVFKDQGLKVRFEIKDNDGSVKFGDVRYSFIKFTEELDQRAPLGYGPSDANPFTGEIVAGNTMIWTGYLKYYLKVLNDKAAREETRFDKSSIYKQMRIALEEDSVDEWTSTSKPIATGTEIGDIFHDMLPSFTYGYPGWSRFTFRGLPGEASKKFAAPLDSDLMGLTRIEESKKFMQRDSAKVHAAIEGALSFARESIHAKSKGNMHHRDTTLFPVEYQLATARKMFMEDVTPEQILNTILYRVAIHEFGHNLNLRHNFYGSVDEKNFADPIPAVGKDGKPVMVKNADGELVQKTYQQRSSSVMEYLSLQDEVHLQHEWENYDKAAMTYAYSTGKVDLAKTNNTKYLYCTDEHRVLNALCNTWDSGTTASEIAMSMITAYEDMYWSSNFRYGRAYWNTAGYPSRVFGIMSDMKKFLMLWRSAMTETEIQKRLADKMSDDDINAVTLAIHKDLKQAVKLSIAFYNSVIQQSAVDRHYRDEYDEWNGELKRIGIFYDKIFAMMFLMSDDSFMYNPNRQLSYASFLSYKSDRDLGDIIEKVMENAMTVRVDMDPWFIGFGRSLYSMNAYNFNNMSDASLIHKVRFACYKPQTLKSQFGIDPYEFVPAEDEEPIQLVAELVDNNINVVDPYFKGSAERLAVIEVAGKYYVASETKNPYAYSIVWNMIQQDKRFGNSLGTAKDDVLEVHRLFHMVTQQRVPDCQ